MVTLISYFGQPFILILCIGIYNSWYLQPIHTASSKFQHRNTLRYVSNTFITLWYYKHYKLTYNIIISRNYCQQCAITRNGTFRICSIRACVDLILMEYIINCYFILKPSRHKFWHWKPISPRSHLERITPRVWKPSLSII